MYDTLESDSKNPLYSECEGSLTLLSAVLSLVNVKARYRRSDKNFTSLLKVVQGMLPEENTLPKSYYEVKKILCWMGMEYKKIHTCPNDCILYIHEFEEMQKWLTLKLFQVSINLLVIVSIVFERFMFKP